MVCGQFAKYRLDYIESETGENLIELVKLYDDDTCLYFVADVSVTLLRRARAGGKLMAHRTHYDQRARDNGFTNIEIVRRVFLVNVGLVVLATLSVVDVTAGSRAAALLIGVGLVAWLLISFVRVRP